MFEVVIGLEIHAQVKSKSKLFSSAENSFAAEQNTNVEFIDMGLPGVLPRLNKFCIDQAIRTGLAINGVINKYSAFDRKHYFYPDLPNGYQISQFFYPIVSDGYIDLLTKRIRIERIHLEQDAGKLIHDLNPKYSYIDLNRAGVPLMEIVTKPDIRSANEAIEFFKKLQLILKYIGSCDGDMEKGNLRCDVNISLKLPESKVFGNRCEVKNLNSIKSIELAIEYEIKRQTEILLRGGVVDQETRLFDFDKNETRKLRGKGDSHAYRYLPDMDLLPINLTDQYINQVKQELPELPDDRRQKYENMQLNHEFIKSMVESLEVGDYFDKLIKIASNRIKFDLIANWLNVELLARINKLNLSLSEMPCESFIELLLLIEQSVINGKIAKDVLDKMLFSKKSAMQIVQDDNLSQITDFSVIENIIEQVFLANPEKIAEYKSGKTKLFDFFVGQTMKKGQGKFNPEIVNKLINEKLLNNL